MNERSEILNNEFGIAPKEKETYFDIPNSNSKLLRKTSPEGKHSFYYGSDNTNFAPLQFYYTPEEIKKHGYFKNTGKLINGSNIMGSENSMLDHEADNILSRYISGEFLK